MGYPDNADALTEEEKMPDLPNNANPGTGTDPAGAQQDPPNGDPKDASKDYTPPATQDELNKIVQDRLARATKGVPSKEELAELKRKADEHDKAERDKLPAEQRTQQELTAATTRATTAEAKLARYEAAEAAELPLSMAGRIQGDTPEAMIEDAKQLKTLLGSTDPNAPRAPKPDQSQGPRQSPKVSPKDAGKAEAARRFGKQ